MKNLLIAVSLILTGCNGFSQNTNVNTKSTEAKVLVYFFHGTHRCQGCLNAEKGTVNALNELFKTQLENGTIKFQSINVEENQNKVLAEKYEAAWNKLVFVKNNDPGKPVDLTEQAFAYGTSNPKELNKIVKETVDKMLD